MLFVWKDLFKGTFLGFDFITAIKICVVAFIMFWMAKFRCNGFLWRLGDSPRGEAFTAWASFKFCHATNICPLVFQLRYPFYICKNNFFIFFCNNTERCFLSDLCSIFHYHAFFLGITLLSFIPIIKNTTLPVKCVKIQHFSLCSLPKLVDRYFSFCYSVWYFFWRHKGEPADTHVLLCSCTQSFLR